MQPKITYVILTSDHCIDSSEAFTETFEPKETTPFCQKPTDSLRSYNKDLRLYFWKGCCKFFRGGTLYIAHFSTQKVLQIPPVV